MPAQAPEAPQCIAPENLSAKTFGELAVPAFDQLPGYQKEAIRWAPVIISLGKNPSKYVSFIESITNKGLRRNVYRVQTAERALAFITETSQLQSKFKHASVFGITGNQTKETRFNGQKVLVK